MQYTTPPWFLDFHCGGVWVFFVISGLVMRASIGDEAITPGYAARFALRRSIRIDPAFWASLLMTTALHLFIATQVERFGGQIDPLYQTPSLGRFIANAAYLNRWLDIRSINGVSWTLCIEMQFYLLLLALTALAQRFRISLDALCVPFVVLSACVIDETGGEHFPLPLQTSISVLATFLPFYLGMAVYRLIERGEFRWLLFAMSVCVVREVASSDKTVLFSAFAALLISIAYFFGGLKTWLSGPLFQWLGRISYSLYLVHCPIARVIHLACRRLLPDSVGGEVATFAFQLIASVTIAAVMYYLIEKPTVALSRRIRKNGPLAYKAIAASAVGIQSSG